MRFRKLRRHSSGQAFVEYKGKRIYLGRWGSQKALQRYKQFLADLLAAEANGHEPIVILTVAELIRSYLLFARTCYVKNERPSSEYHAVKSAAGPLLAKAGDKLVDQFGPDDLKAVRQEMIARGWTRKNINQQVKRVRRIFAWGVENSLVPASVLTSLQTVRPLRRNRTAAREAPPIKPVDSWLVLATVHRLAPTVAAMVQLQHLTGMRSENLCLMQSHAIDQSGDVWVYTPHSHKTHYLDNELRVALGPAAQKLVVPFLAGRGGHDYLFSPAESEAWRRAQQRAARKSAVQPSQQNRKTRRPQRKPGAHYTPTSYRRAVQYACKKAGLTKWTPAQLRHSRGTLLRKSYGVEGAQVSLGHSRADVTQIYAERDWGLALKIASEVG